MNDTTATTMPLTEGAEPWREVIASAGLADPFQTLAWLHAEQDCHGRDVQLVIVEENSRPIGGLAVINRRIMGVWRGREAIGGPLAVPGREATVFASVVRALQSDRGSYLYLALRPPASHNLGVLAVAAGLRASPLPTFIVDLTRSEGDLWAALDGNARTGIRRGERAQVCVSAADDWPTWQAFGEVHAAHFRQMGIPPFSEPELQYFHRALRPAGACRLFVSTVGGELAAGMMFLIGHRSMRFLINSSRPEMLPLSPNDPIMWHALLWARANGITMVDLYDTDPRETSPLYGIHRFKGKWGGQFVDQPYYVRGRLYHRLREWKRESAGVGLLAGLMSRLARA